MKKTSLLLFALFLLTSHVILAEESETDKGFNFGIGTGGFPFPSGQNGLIFSVGIGYGFTDRLAIRADISYVQSTNSILSEVSQGTSYSGDFDNSVMPFCLSFLYNTPVNESFSAAVGIGAGHYSITLKENATTTNPYVGTINRFNTYKFSALAPHFLVGIETSLSSRIVFFGEIRHTLIKTKLEKEESNYYSKDDFFMGGVSLKVGIRFYFERFN